VLFATPSGMKTLHFNPYARAAHAAASPAFPPEAMTMWTVAPRSFLAFSMKWEMPLYLNEWLGWRFWRGYGEGSYGRFECWMVRRQLPRA